jgi:hypothetical protein
MAPEVPFLYEEPAVTKPQLSGTAGQTAAAEADSSAKQRVAC